MNKLSKDLDVFELELGSALKSSGHLFPTTDRQMEQFLENAETVPAPLKYQTPDFIFKEEFISVEQIKGATATVVDYSGTPMYALAARNGKNLPQHILDKMKEDKKKTSKK